MTREDIIRMSREAGLFLHPKQSAWVFRASMDFDDRVIHFAALVAAAERDRMTVNSIHTCHAECDRPGCVRVREAVKAEREACAKVCEEMSGPIETYNPKYAYFLDCAAAIRARGET